MNLSKLFSSVGLASMLAMTTIVASPKPKAASAQLAEENSIILVNPGETSVAEFPTADSPVVSNIPNRTALENSSVLHATALQPNVEAGLDSRYFDRDSDGFKVVREAEQKPGGISIRIKSPPEIFQSLMFYVLIGVVILIVAILFFFEVIKFIVGIILLPLKILLSLFR